VKRRRNFRSLTATEVAVVLLTQLQRLQRPSDEPMLWASVQLVTTATGLAVGLLSSADAITPVLCSDGPPVQPVLKTWLLHAWHRLWNIVHPIHRCQAWRRRFNRWLSYLDLVFAWSPFGAQICSDARASELPTTIGCTDAAELIQFSVSLSSFFVYCFAWPFYLMFT